MQFDPDHRYRLSSQVALRHEDFGALAYHYGNRRLTFLRSTRLVEVVESLESHDSARAALALVPLESRGMIERALASLSESEVICAF